MERIISVVFDKETNAYKASKALNELDVEGSISIHAKAVITKRADGRIDVKDEGDEFPIRTIGGTTLGALIGLLGGPVGAGIGAVTGTIAGGILDLDRAGINAGFLEEISHNLTPGKWAIVADINEEWETPLNTSMASLQGSVHRIEREEYLTKRDAKEIEELTTEIAQLEKEKAKASAEHKARIQVKINDRKKKLKEKREQLKSRVKQRHDELRTKIEALDKKLSKVKGAEKSKIEARIAELKEKEKKDAEASNYLKGEGVSIHY